MALSIISKINTNNNTHDAKHNMHTTKHSTKHNKHNTKHHAKHHKHNTKVKLSFVLEGVSLLLRILSLLLILLRTLSLFVLAVYLGSLSNKPSGRCNKLRLITHA